VDINSIGIGAILGAIIVVSVNLYLNSKSLSYDIAKEQLQNLYNPLNAFIENNKIYLEVLKMKDDDFEKFAIEYFKFFLKLRDLYLNNEVYASSELKAIFNTLNVNLKTEFYNYSSYKNNSLLKEEVYNQIALFELKHQIDENGYSEIERHLNKFIEVLDNDIYIISTTHKPINIYNKDKNFFSLLIKSS
jgi:hypothetical protein